jgi:predicted ATPase
VCADGALPTDSLVELVAGLVDKSVVIREDHGARVRYRLLETIRQYGRGRLREAGKEAALRRRHRDWCRRLAPGAGRAVRPGSARLVIAQRTVEGHVDHILTKLGFTSRAQLAAWMAGNRARFGR